MENELIEEAIRKHEEDVSTSEILSTEVKSATSEGEGYTSTIQRWKFKTKLRSGRIIFKSFIVKKIPDDEIQKRFMLLYSLIEKETEVYQNVFGSIETLMSEHEDSRDTLWCKFIGNKQNKLIILEDLKILNYKMVKDIGNFDFDHVMLTMFSLGRVHGLSKVAVEKGLIEKDKLRNYALAQDEKALEMYSEGGIRTFENVVRNKWGPEWTWVADKFKKDIPNLKKKVAELFEVDKEKFNVFNHGDLWACNLLFKYHDYKPIPITAKFVDFQFCHYNSLAWDLVFFLFSSVSTDLRRKHFLDFINGYFTSFTDTLNLYNFKGERPTEESLLKELDRFLYVQLVMLCTVYAVTTSDIDEPLFVKSIDDPVERLHCYNPLIFESEKYKSEISEDIIDFIRKGVI